jgi:hypothetical protein
MRFVALLMTVVCAVSALVSAQDDSDRATQSRIVALEKAWNQAYKLADRKALNELLDDQLVLVNDDGSVQDKGEFLASNAATAIGVFRAKGVEGGKPYLKRERFLDTWIYKDGKWRCATAAAITVAH